MGQTENLKYIRTIGNKLMVYDYQVHPCNRKCKFINFVMLKYFQNKKKKLKMGEVSNR